MKDMKDPSAVPHGPDTNDRGPEPGRSNLPNLLRTCFGAVLFVAWGILTILWVASTVYSVANGNIAAAVTAVAALALLVLLGGMEGLEVSVIDRWQKWWPQWKTSDLAGWLAARQLFVALIVTAATLLADRPVIVVPGTSVRTTNGFVLSVFDLVWTTLTVLWFAQIFWKHLGATNPDRYLTLLCRPLLPIVRVVHWLGISQPGEWTADVVEGRLDWAASPEELQRQRPAHELSHASIWRELPMRRMLHRRRARSGGEWTADVVEDRS
jgi:hypothetical protein